MPALVMVFFSVGFRLFFLFEGGYGTLAAGASAG
jgi:hypothetical protein